MTIIYRNGKIIGCEHKGHSLILCQDCMVTDVADCPMQQELLKQSQDDGYVPNHVINPYEEVALEIAKLVSRKQIEYGNSFSFSYDIIKVLYPNGISLEQIKDLLVVIRIIDKLFRIANGNLGSEDAFSDIIGYGLLSVVRNKNSNIL